jgi:hypothetical protein
VKLAMETKPLQMAPTVAQPGFSQGRERRAAAAPRPRPARLPSKKAMPCYHERRHTTVCTEHVRGSSDEACRDGGFALTLRVGQGRGCLAHSGAPEVETNRDMRRLL